VKRLANVHAIGFDVDGTLYQTPDAMGVAVGKILIEKAATLLNRDPDELAEEYLKRRDEYRSNTYTLNSFGLPGVQIFQEVWDSIAIEDYVVKDTRLIEMIRQLKKRYALFLISNGTGKQVERKLTHLGLDYHDFEPRIYCYDHGWMKPDPQPFLAAIASLDLKPEEIVYVGDREDIDIEGAHSVGMQAIYVGGMCEVADASCETVYDMESLFI
jgi:HAD superfamily hydrolase (TIGR01549 family)